MKKGKPDYFLSILIFGLAIFGIVMISSASIVKSFEVTDGATNNLYLYRQLAAFAIGILAWIFAQRTDYHIFKKYSIWFLIGSFVLLALVFVPVIGKNFGANRWIGVGSFVFQPSELVKLFLVIFLAAWLSKSREAVESFWRGFVPFILIMLGIGALIILQPDMGTLVVIAIVALVIFFVAGANLWYLAASLPLFAAIFYGLVRMAPYRVARLMAFIKPGEDVLGVGYHINQAIIAIGSGGLWGLGFGNSKQKFNYLPEAASDSIYAIICEELGFIRAAVVIVVFALIAIRGYTIAKKVPDDFGRLLAIGITSWFIIQAAINLAAMLGLIPLTGVPLPFVSYGGSALVISMAAVGILLNISKHANRVKS